MNKLKPTEAELEILQILWKHGASTVRFVNEQLNEQREVGYTTTLKMMQVMHEKGLLLRDDSQRTHVFRAQITEEDTQKSLLDRLLHTAFGGSAMKLVQQALGNHQTSKEELQKIKKLIDKMEKGGEL
ncbi:MAG: BlaI/MecI/CopY family transcriptional regulator [Microscillaceae bacterium]|nr:BlaI/MecI/CopY family transcriptional regulator [Microscillaceae bacterium]